MNKKILTVAGIIFALVFILLLAIMFGNISTKTSDSTNKMVDTFNATDNTNSDAYAEGANYKGSEVIALIQNIDAITGSSNTTVKVKQSSNDNSSTVTYSSTNRYDGKASRDKSSNSYINPSSNYNLTKITTRANGTISEYEFTRQ